MRDSTSTLRFLATRVDRMRASEIRELLRLIHGKDIISFAGGAPDPSTFPSDEEIKEAVEFALQHKKVSLQYGITEGQPEFREEICKFMERVMNIRATPEEVIVTVGSQQAIELTGRIFINYRDRVAVGLPTYLATIQAFNLWRPRYVGIPIRDDGMDLTMLEEYAKICKEEGEPIKLVYVIPTGDNPTGTIMSLEKRKYLLELASKYEFIIIEDDPYGFITFTEDIPPRLKSLDYEGRVVYISSFSKIFAPGLRVGWVTSTKEIIKHYGLGIQSSNLCPSTFLQYIVMYFLKMGYIEKNIQRIRQIYKVKRDAMLEALDEYMPKEASWTRPNAGFFVFVYFPNTIDSKRLLQYCLINAGVAFVPGRGFFVDESGFNTARLSYSQPKPEAIREGIRRLGEAVRDVIRGKVDLRLMVAA